MEIADRTWWVGSAEPGETFQCHPYLLEAGDESVLIDPGSPLTLARTLDKVRTVMPLDRIKWVVCHHSDPDIAAALPQLRLLAGRDDTTLVTEWRANTLIRHYGHGFPVFLVDDHDWHLTYGDRELRFVLTPYLHFPGAMCSWDPSTKVLFSSDLFGGFTDGSELYADADYFDRIRTFHEHYMPSHDILAAGLMRLRRDFPDIDLIAPQHGCIIRRDLVDAMFDQLNQLECGIFLLAREDSDVERLLRVNSVIRRVTDALVTAHEFADLITIATAVLQEVLPISELEVFVDEGEDEWMHYVAPDWKPRPEAPGEPTAGVLRLHVPSPTTPAELRLHLVGEVPATAELEAVFERLVPAIRAAVERQVDVRRAAIERAALNLEVERDPLTGLHNRRHLERIDPADAVRRSALMIDIDHFKRLNDRFGHQTGDQVLCQVAAALTDATRSTDDVIRYGGEEFLVLVADTDPDNVAAAGQRVNDTIRNEEWSWLGPTEVVTVSVGICVTDQRQDLDQLIANADQALYRAKADGRDRVRSWSDVDQP